MLSNIIAVRNKPILQFLFENISFFTSFNSLQRQDLTNFKHYQSQHSLAFGHSGVQADFENSVLTPIHII